MAQHNNETWGFSGMPMGKRSQSRVKQTPGLITVFVLRVRDTDDDPWGEPVYYRTRRERDREASVNRVLGGIRAHSYQEKKTIEEVEQIFS